MYPLRRYISLALAAACLAAGAEAGVKRLRIQKGEVIKPGAEKVEAKKLRALSPPIKDAKIIETKKGDQRIIEIAADDPDAKPLKIKKSKRKLLRPRKQKAIKDDKAEPRFDARDLAPAAQSPEILDPAAEPIEPAALQRPRAKSD